MKTFNQFMVESTVEPAKLIDKLEKTHTSINGHISRGGQSWHQRGRELAYRYTGLRDALRKTPEGNTHWKKYCANHNYDLSHEGYDHYA